MRTSLPALVAAVLATGWGTAHLFPTRTIVHGFGDIGTENRRVITMEWIYEGTTLIFTGLVTAAVTLIGNDASTTAAVVYVVTAGLLIVMAVVAADRGRTGSSPTASAPQSSRRADPPAGGGSYLSQLPTRKRA